MNKRKIFEIAMAGADFGFGFDSISLDTIAIKYLLKYEDSTKGSIFENIQMLIRFE